MVRLVAGFAENERTDARGKIIARLSRPSKKNIFPYASVGTFACLTTTAAARRGKATPPTIPKKSRRSHTKHTRVLRGETAFRRFGDKHGQKCRKEERQNPVLVSTNPTQESRVFDAFLEVLVLMFV
jgi:hypothetical protein